MSFEFVQERQPEWERFVHVPMEALTIDVADTIGYRLELSIEVTSPTPMLL